MSSINSFTAQTVNPNDLGVRLECTTAQVITAGAVTFVNWDTVVGSDTLGGFSLATPDRIIIPTGRAGRYPISAAAWLDSPLDSRLLFIFLQVNGLARYNQDRRVTNNAMPNPGGGVSDVLPLNEGDEIRLGIFLSPGGDRTIHATGVDPITYLSVCKSLG